MKRYATAGFHSMLKTLMDKHHLSAGSLGHMLGEPTALRRALNNQLSDSKRNELFQSIRLLSVFTPEEETALAESLTISRLGLERYMYMQALDGWLYPAKSDGETISGNNLLLDFLCALDTDTEIAVLCVNSLFHSVLSVFRALLQNSRINISIRHYFMPTSPDRSLAEYLLYAKDLIFDKRYSVYTPGGEYANSAHLPVDGNLIIIKGKINGKSHEALYVAISENELCRFPGGSANGVYDYFYHLLEQPMAATPLRQEPQDPLDYSSTCLEFLGNELNRKTLILTPDLSMALMPPAVLKNAVNNRLPLRLTDPIAMNHLVSLHATRYQYSNDTTKERCLITSRSGLQHFLRTGKLADHPAMLRPLLPEERLPSLDTVLHYVANNRHLSFRLLMDESIRYPYQLRCHDHLSVTLHKPTLAHRHELPYVTLCSPVLADEIQDYLSEDILKRCHTGDESLRQLRQIRDEYAASLNS